MTNSTTTATTLGNIGVTMFTVSDVEASLAWYVEKLGFEVRADVRFGESGENRWLEIAPPGSAARLSINPPMNSSPGGGSIGIESSDVEAEHERLTAMDGVAAGDLMRAPGAPLMFSVRDPDGNWLWITPSPDA